MQKYTKTRNVVLYRNAKVHDSVVPVRVTTAEKWKQVDLLIWCSKGAENREQDSQAQSQDNPRRVSGNTKDVKSVDCNSMAEKHYIVGALL